MVAAARDMASEEAPFVTVATGYASEILYEGVALKTTPIA